MQQVLQSPDHDPPHLAQLSEHRSGCARLAVAHKPQFTMSVLTGPGHEVGVVAECELFTFSDVSGGKAGDGCAFDGVIRGLRIGYASVVDAGQ